MRDFKYAMNNLIILLQYRGLTLSICHPRVSDTRGKLNLLTSKSFLKLILIPLFLYFFQPISFSQDFEGIINYRYKFKDNSVTTFNISGNDVLMVTKVDNLNFKLLSNRANDIFYMLSEKNGERLAVKNSLNSPHIQKNIEEREKNLKALKKEFDVQVTNETKTIDGYKCKKIMARSNYGKGVAWVTKEIGFSKNELLPMTNNVGKTFEQRIEMAFAEKGFIMEIETKNFKSGAESHIITEVKQKKIAIRPNSILQSYEIMDMTDINALMEQLNKDPSKAERLKRAFQGED